MTRILTLKERLQTGQKGLTKPLSLPAPVGGWNTRDELDAMDPLDAVVLDNFYPDTEGVKVRRGSVSYATGMGAGAVETLAEFQAGNVTRMLAACSGSIFDASAPGAVGTAISTGYVSNRWQTTNFLNRLFLVNGTDTAQIYDGTTIANAAFTGVSLATLVGVHQYQQRLFFWQNNSPGFWYALINSLSGALAFYDLSVFCPRGGVLIAVTTITHDGGDGVLDYIAFIMSSGDMLLFLGNDPALISNWQMIGRYRVAPPVNIRGICAYGGDSFVATFDDYMPLQAQLAALRLGQLPARSKISGAVQAAIQANGSAFGWQALYYPKGRRLIFNVPNIDGTFDQHVCNTSLPNQPWCRFKGMNAACWALFGDNLFFGGATGTVYQADVSGEDDGTSVSAVGQQAWNKARMPSGKRISAVRPIVQSTEGAYEFDIGYDYRTSVVRIPVALDGPDITDDAGLVITDDTGDPICVGVAGINLRWRVAGGMGTAFAFAINLLSSGSTAWLRTDFRYEPSAGL